MNDKLGHQPLHPNHVGKKNSDRGARKRNCGSSSFFSFAPSQFSCRPFFFLLFFPSPPHDVVHVVHTYPIFFFSTCFPLPVSLPIEWASGKGPIKLRSILFFFLPVRHCLFSYSRNDFFLFFAQEHRNEYSILPSPPFSICYLSSYTPCVCVYVTFRVYIYIVSEIESVNIDGLNQWDGRRERNKVRLFLKNYFSFFRFLLLFLPRFRTK